MALNNRETLTDGDFYHSRCRVNRHVVTCSGGEVVNHRLNGKVSKIVIDASDSALMAGSGSTGTFRMFMDIQDGSGAQIPYFDEIAVLNYSGSGSDQVIVLETTPGANRGTASAKNSLHFSVTTPANVTSGGTAINEPAAWNGLVCGNVQIVCGAAHPSLLDPDAVIRVIIYLE